jgi:phosphoribosylformylglycinamidine cyclo-ligase
MCASSYHEAGVRAGDDIPGFKALLRELAPTFGFAGDARPVIDFGFYANVIPFAPNLGVAISTDGVGTKILVAQAMEKYDTIGIDCVAMNVNDVICVGARPLSLVDYIAVETADDRLLEELGKGLAEGARQAGVSIPGGELAQVKDMIRGDHRGVGFDLVATCIGAVALDKVITGRGIKPGDRIIGLASSGVHSNGLTLARKSFGDLGEYIPELQASIGSELLKPTTIYVKAAMAMLDSGIDVKAFAHITSDGFLNLLRLDTSASFVLDTLPPPQPVFEVIARRGEIPLDEMFVVFNMGIGFIAVVNPADEARAIATTVEQGYSAQAIGFVKQEDRKRVHLPQHQLIGEHGRFIRG